MASIFQHPIQALKGEANGPSSGPLATVELAKSNGILYDTKRYEDNRWVWTAIDGTRWNKSYPYQILVLKRVGDQYVEDPGFGRFTLPIPPQEISIGMPFAISASVTQGGIVEEHNGAPIRTISFSGTTGVAPLKGTGTILSQSSIVGGIFAGTLNAAGNVASNALHLAGRGTSTNLMDDSDDTLRGTGYFQFILLQRFLEGYAKYRKLAAGRDARLALAMWKDQAVYLVTPVSFNTRRSASSPFEYSYQLDFRAWRRVTLNTGGPAAFDGFRSVVRDPHAFAQLLNKLSDARRVLQASRDVLVGINADVEKVLLEPLREVTLFCKDALGVVHTAADLPASLQSSLKTAVLEAKKLPEVVGSLGVASGKNETGGGDQANNKDALDGADPANKDFQNPADNFDMFDKIRPNELDLPPRIQKRIAEEKERIRKRTRLDFERDRDKFVEFAAAFADAVGAGSTRYNETFNRPAATTSRTPTQDDFDALFALNQVILEMNRLAATSDVNSSQITTVESVAGMASASGIAFKIPVSKFAVPFPYGSTLEQLAALYLGSPDRWHEIVALNGLRQPYVDEEGFELPLIVNGSGNQVTVADNGNLYIGQPVWISSTNTSRTMRRVTDIERLAGNAILTVDGDADLDRFDVLAQASIHAFLPDTVNSQMLIYIPSDDEPEEGDYKTKSIPGIDEFDPLIKAGGTDLLLTQSGDLAITPDGDCRLATGLTNLIQRIRTVLATPKGSLLHHPEYGLGLEVGVNTADLDVRQMMASLQNLFRSDPAFAGVSGVAISKEGPVARVSMSVRIAGTSQTIPISVDIRR